MTQNEIVAKIKNIDRRIAYEHAHNALERYNVPPKVHLKQLAFHKCLKRNRWVFGGNRSGKTECGAVEVVWLARGCHPYRENKPTSGWVVSLTREVQRDVAQSKILHYLHPKYIADIVMVSGKASFPEGGVIDYILVKNVFGSVSRIGFKSCDQGREKFQGTSLNWVWFDEEPPEEIYSECRMRVLDTEGDIFGTMTPLLGLTWVYYDIFMSSKSNEIWHETMEWADNPYLKKSEVMALTSSMSKSELRTRRYGEFASLNGRVYDEFDENIHVIDPFEVPKEWYNNLSIDPGLNNPLSCHFYAVNGDGVVFVVAEHYEAGKDVAYHLRVIKGIAEALEWHTDREGRLEALIDSAASQRTLASCKSVAELFSEGGVNVNLRVNKDVFAGINRVKAFLKPSGKSPKLFIFSTCVNMIREMKGYYWSSGDTPVKKDDHAMDELRYFIMSRPSPYEEAVALSDIEKHKNKLIRKLKLKRKS